MKRRFFKKAATKVTMTQKLAVAIIGAACMMLSACSSSSPEKDGIKAAKMYAEVNSVARKNKNAIELELVKVYEQFIETFNYTSQIDATEALNELQNKSTIFTEFGELKKKIKAEYGEQHGKAQEFHHELKSKYAADEEATEKFNCALENYRGEQGVIEDIERKRYLLEATIKKMIEALPRQ